MSKEEVDVLSQLPTFQPANFTGELISSQEVRIGESWVFVRVYSDVIHFEDMDGNFLGIIKKKA